MKIEALQVQQQVFPPGSKCRMKVRVVYSSGTQRNLYLHAGLCDDQVLLHECASVLPAVFPQAITQTTKEFTAADFTIVPDSQGGPPDGTYGIIVWFDESPTTPGVLGRALLTIIASSKAHVHQSNLIVVSGNSSQEIILNMPSANPPNPALGDPVVISCPIVSTLDIVYDVKINVYKGLPVGWSGEINDTQTKTGVQLHVGENVVTFNTTAKGGDNESRDVTVYLLANGNEEFHKSFDDVFAVGTGGDGGNGGDTGSTLDIGSMFQLMFMMMIMSLMNNLMEGDMFGGGSKPSPRPKRPSPPPQQHYPPPPPPTPYRPVYYPPPYQPPTPVYMLPPGRSAGYYE